MASNLNNARINKKDEFYTRFTEINDEINTNEHGYRPFFKDKIVYCNCDDPEESNFWKFFKTVFKAYGIKKLISTHYTQDGSSSYKLEYDGERVAKTELEGNGDFRSPECVELLKESDVVVTNPPFSLYSQYIELLVKHNKKFIVWANNNSIPLKNIFPLIRDGKMWLGYTCNKSIIFEVPENYEYNQKITDKINDGKHYGVVPSISVFTNLDIPKRHEPLLMGWRYEKGLEMGMYAKYENYDAINVNEVCEIPKDYFGLMGVPITFLDKFCPEQFEIVGCASGWAHKNTTKEYKEMVGYKPLVSDQGTRGYGIVDGKQKYHRLLIKRIQK